MAQARAQVKARPMR